MIGRQVICSKCRRVATCRAVLDVQHAPRRVFCDQACMVLFVREEYMEFGSTGAPAGTSSPDRRSAVAGQGEVPGAAREPVGSGKSPVAPSRSTFVGRWPDFLRSVLS